MVKQMLTQLNIPFEIRDISIHPQYQQEVEQYGFLGVPVTVIEGEAIKGYHPEDILQLLG